jgi:hypothetical protein
MDTTSINDLPGDNININMNVDKSHNMNQIISSIQQASKGGIIELPSRDIPNDTESNVIIDPEIKPNYMDETPNDYIKRIESVDELMRSIKTDERAELKRIELYDSIHAYVIMACVYFFLMLPFFHTNIMMKYFAFGLSSDGNMNIKGYVLKTFIFVGTCFSITESINYLDRIADI